MARIPLLLTWIALARWMPALLAMYGKGELESQCDLVAASR
jgi:hypothetical protein